jgi:hypothetical protein
VTVSGLAKRFIFANNKEADADAVPQNNLGVQLTYSPTLQVKYNWLRHPFRRRIHFDCPIAGTGSGTLFSREWLEPFCLQWRSQTLKLERMELIC